MQDLAISAPSAAPAAPKPGRKPRISPRVKRAIELMVTGECKTQKDAAAKAGITPEHLCNELKKPQAEVFYEQRSRETISRAKMRASRRLEELLDASSEHVSLDASKHVLSIAGIAPASTGTNISITNNIAPGYVIDMRDPRDAQPMRTVDAQAIHSHTTKQDQ
jgi:hypothetical protein